MTVTRFLAVLAGSLLIALQARAAAPAHGIDMPPPAPGPYPVACSNLALNPAIAAQEGRPVDDYLAGTGRYVTDLLAEPFDTLIARPRLPNESLYSRHRGDVMPFVVIACFPTFEGNTRPDYVLPGGEVIPRMQRAGQPMMVAPPQCTLDQLAAGTCPRWPLVIFSHGLAGYPVDGKSIDFLTRLASYGYVVAAPFHGDRRFADLKIEDLEDLARVLIQFDRACEMQAVRPLSVKAVIDLMLAHPEFGPRVDAERIGGIGGSMGGATLTWLLGAELTDSLVNKTSTRTVQDPRMKAVVGYVPYAGQPFLPAFGDDNATGRFVTRPYLSIVAGNDTTAPPALMAQALNNFKGDRYQVTLDGIGHTYEAGFANDVFGWTVPFFAAYLKDDRAALDQLVRQRRVAGGLNDHLDIDYTAPTARRAGEVLVEEFHSPVFRRYFLTSRASDKDILDRGLAGRDWARTGYAFKAFAAPGPTQLPPPSWAPVCRFFFPAILTHFYSTEAADCNLVRTLGTIDEGIDFWIHHARDAACPPQSIGVTRLYNNKWRENDSNHRYTTSRSLVRSLVAQGWIDEGVVMCAPL